MASGASVVQAAMLPLTRQTPSKSGLPDSQAGWMHDMREFPPSQHDQLHAACLATRFLLDASGEGISPMHVRLPATGRPYRRSSIATAPVCWPLQRACWATGRRRRT